MSITTKDVSSDATPAASLDTLLSSDNAEVPVATETESEQPATEETEVVDAGNDEPAEVDADATSEEDDAPAETTDEPEEESELTLGESDRDFSEAAYKKAADHFSKTKGFTYDPADPKDRATLKEFMDRGEALKAQKAEREAAAAAKTEKADEAEKVDTPTVVTPAARAEQVKQLISNAQTVAKARLVPEVASHVANRFVKALWPQTEEPVSQEQANEITSALSEMFWMAMQDAMPAVYGGIHDNLSQDPIYSRVTTNAVREAALESLDGRKNAAGKPMFGDLEAMVTDGRMQSTLKANPFIAQIKAGNGKDPVKNYEAQLEAAYKIARGEQSPETVQRAVETGKNQVMKRNARVAASRVAAGNTKGAPGGKVPTEAEKLISSFDSGGSKFSALIAASQKK